MSLSKRSLLSCVKMNNSYRSKSRRGKNPKARTRDKATQTLQSGLATELLSQYWDALKVTSEDMVRGTPSTSGADVSLLGFLFAHFERLLHGDVQGQRAEAIDLATFRVLAEYARTGLLQLTPANVTSVLNTALTLGSQTVVLGCEDFLLRTGDVFENLALACTLQLAALRADCRKLIRGMTHVSESQFLRFPPDLLVRWLREDRLVVVRRGLPLTARLRELYLLRCLPVYFTRLRRSEEQDTWALPAMLNLHLEHLPRDELEKTAESLLEKREQEVFRKALDARLGVEGKVKAKGRVWTETRVKTSPPFGPGSDEAIQSCSEFLLEPRLPRQKMTEVRVWARTRHGTHILSGLQVTYGKGENSQTISAGDLTSTLVCQYRTLYDDEIISNVFVFKGEWIPSLEFAWDKVGQLSRAEGSEEVGQVVGASDSAFRCLHSFRGQVVSLEDGTTAIRLLRFVFEEFAPQLPEGVEPLIIAVGHSSAVSLQK